jgi:hypothetical protein
MVMNIAMIVIMMNFTIAKYVARAKDQVKQ